jgi:hypothetical protein
MSACTQDPKRPRFAVSVDRIEAGGCRWRRTPALEAGVGHAGVVRGGFDGRAVAFAVLALVLAVVLGAVAGTRSGAAAGALAAVAGLVPPAVLAVAIERRSRILARERARREVLQKYAPPGSPEEGEGSQ